MNMLQGQTHTVMFPFISTLRQYGGIRLRVHFTLGLPNVKDCFALIPDRNSDQFHMQILPWDGIDLASLGVRVKRLDLSPREVHCLS